VLATIGRTIEVGDLIRLTISRGGGPREILVEAASEPPDHRILTPDAGQVVIHLDSVRGAILQNLDSLRLSIAGLKVDSSGDLSIRILRPQPEPPTEDTWLNLTYRIWGPGGDSLRTIPPEVMVFEPDLAVPFAAVVASSKETQELREQLKQVRSQLTESRREELAREREIRSTTQGPVEEILRRDERMQEIREREAVLVEEVNRLNAQLESASQSELRRQFAEVQARQEEAMANARRAREELSQRARREREDSARVRERELDLMEEYELQRPLNYIIAGQSFVAGAQLQTLNPDLASYFQVDRGVLVTEVLEGTPADEAGLLSGDVITQVGGERVSSLNDLRFGIGYFERPLRLRVVRKGAPLEIVIR
jgi:hypothetical protein